VNSTPDERACPAKKLPKGTIRKRLLQVLVGSSEFVLLISFSKGQQTFGNGLCQMT
jgi:hypothetical protein